MAYFFIMDNESYNMDNEIVCFCNPCTEMKQKFLKIMGFFESANHFEILKSYSVKHFVAN